MSTIKKCSLDDISRIFPNADLDGFVETTAMIEDVLRDAGINCPIIFGETMQRILTGQKDDVYNIAVNPYFGRGKFHRLMDIALEKDLENPHLPAAYKHINTTLLGIALDVSRALNDENAGSFCLHRDYPSFVISRIRGGGIVMNLCFGSSAAYNDYRQPQGLMDGLIQYFNSRTGRNEYMTPDYLVEAAETTRHAVAYDITANRLSYASRFPNDAAHNIYRVKKRPVYFPFEGAFTKICKTEQSRTRGRIALEDIRATWREAQQNRYIGRKLSKLDEASCGNISSIRKTP